MMAKTNPELRNILKIKNMAGAIANHGIITSGQGDELARADERVREQARALSYRVCPDENAASFDKEIPGIDPPSTQVAIVRGPPARKAPANDQERGTRAKLLAAQLEAWAESHQEAFEREYRLAVEAEAKVKAEAEAQAAAQSKMGFSPS